MSRLQELIGRIQHQQDNGGVDGDAASSSSSSGGVVDERIFDDYPGGGGTESFAAFGGGVGGDGGHGADDGPVDGDEGPATDAGGMGMAARYEPDEDRGEKRKDPPSTPTPKPKRARKARKAFSLKDKLRILDEVEGGMKIKDVCIRHDTHRKSIRQWRATRAKIEAQIAAEPRGARTRLNNKKDGLRRIREGVKAFYELNKDMPEDLKLPVTAAIIASKGLEIKDQLLASHAQIPFLEEYEVEMMTAFKGSKAWAGRTAIRYGWSKSKAIDDDEDDKNWPPPPLVPPLGEISLRRVTSRGKVVMAPPADPGDAAVKKWLRSKLPGLRKQDQEAYCERLAEDGFDSVFMLQNLEEGDLGFMKKGHRRALMKEIS